MTPMDELTRLNRLIRQFKTVSHSTPDPEQRARVEAETQDFQSYREQIVAESPKGPRPRRGAALRATFHDLERNVTRFLRDCRRMADDGTGSEVDGETRRQHAAHARGIEMDAASFFRSAEAYCDSLTGDRDAPGGTIAELEDFTSEAVAFLDIPDTNTQENRRADRY